MGAVSADAACSPPTAGWLVPASRTVVGLKRSEGLKLPGGWGGLASAASKPQRGHSPSGASFGKGAPHSAHVRGVGIAKVELVRLGLYHITRAMAAIYFHFISLQRKRRGK